MSGEALAGALGTSQSHLSRVELGDTAASMELVDRWVRECGASPNDRKEAAELAESVVVEFTSWKTWRAKAWRRDSVRRPRPKAPQPPSASGRTDLRPSDVVLAQLDRLALLAIEPHLDIRVLPFANTAPVWHDHGFSIEADRVDGKPDLVNIEQLTGEINISEPGEVAEYKQAYERLAELALPGEEAAAFIRQVCPGCDDCYPDCCASTAATRQHPPALARELATVRRDRRPRRPGRVITALVSSSAVGAGGVALSRT